MRRRGVAFRVCWPDGCRRLKMWQLMRSERRDALRATMFSKDVIPKYLQPTPARMAAVPNRGTFTMIEVARQGRLLSPAG